METVMSHNSQLQHLEEIVSFGIQFKAAACLATAAAASTALLNQVASETGGLLIGCVLPAAADMACLSLLSRLEQCLIVAAAVLELPLAAGA
jgi:hypothetical protein